MKKGKETQDWFSQCYLMDVWLEFSLVLRYAGILINICTEMSKPSQNQTENCMWH